MKEGPPENVFNLDEEEAQPANVAPPAEHEAEVAIELDPAVFNAGNRAEDIESVQNQGLKVDNNNKSAPKNVPPLDQNLNYDNPNEGQSWGFDFIDQQAITRVIHQSTIFQGGWKPKKKSMVDTFVKLLPWEFYFHNYCANFQCSCFGEDQSFD